MRLLIILLLLIIFPSVHASPLIASETKNNLTVNWYLEKQGISNGIYLIDIINLVDIKRDADLSTIFESVNYPATNIKEIKFLEYEEKIDVNTGLKYFAWTESKPIFKTEGKNQRKDDFGLINIGKLETKQFKLDFDLPITINKNGYGSTTQIFIEIDGVKYHPWYNVTWFYRDYLYNISINQANATINRISYDTRIHYIGETIKEDCTDIRITDSNNNELEYNIFSGCLTSNTSIDIYTPANISSFYIYHGNDDALNVSNNTIYTLNVSGGNMTWANTSCTHRTEWIESVTNENIPLFVNDSHGINTTLVSMLSASVGETIYLYHNCIDSRIHLGNTSNLKFWANSTVPGVGGNNPTSVFPSDFELAILGDDSTQANDSSSQNNDGLVTGGITSAPFILGGNILIFDGATGKIDFTVNDYLDNDFTIISFVNATIDADFKTVLSLANTGNDDTIVDFQVMDTGLVRWIWREDDAGSLDFVTGTSDVEGLPHCIAIGKTGAYATVYVDGIAEKTDNIDLSGTTITPNVMSIGYANRATPGSYFDGGIAITYLVTRNMSLSEIQDICDNINNSLTSMGATTVLSVGAGVNGTTEIVYYPDYLIEYQQYSPLYASERTYFPIWNLNWTTPYSSSIYDIEITLDNCGDNINHFDLDTNTFRVQGNVSGVGCLFGECVAKRWSMCVEEKINSTTICQDILNYVDIGDSTLRYGYSGTLPEFIYTFLASGYNSKITNPWQYSFSDISDIIRNEDFYLAYPKEFIFESNCIDNRLTVKYEKDSSLQDVPIDQETSRVGLLGFLSSLSSGLLSLLVTVWNITIFSFSLLSFIMLHPWLIFIIFEMFAMAYALQTTYTISEYLGSYVSIHVKGIEFLINILRWIFDVVLRLISAITNLIPF